MPGAATPPPPTPSVTMGWLMPISSMVGTVENDMLSATQSVPRSVTVPPLCVSSGAGSRATMTMSVEST